MTETRLRDATSIACGYGYPNVDFTGNRIALMQDGTSLQGAELFSIALNPDCNASITAGDTQTHSRGDSASYTSFDTAVTSYSCECRDDADGSDPAIDEVANLVGSSGARLPLWDRASVNLSALPAWRNNTARLDFSVAHRGVALMAVNGPRDDVDDNDVPRLIVPEMGVDGQVNLAASLPEGLCLQGSCSCGGGFDEAAREIACPGSKEPIANEISEITAFQSS